MPGPKILIALFQLSAVSCDSLIVGWSRWSWQRSHIVSVECLLGKDWLISLNSFQSNQLNLTWTCCDYGLSLFCHRKCAVLVIAHELPVLIWYRSSTKIFVQLYLNLVSDFSCPGLNLKSEPLFLIITLAPVCDHRIQHCNIIQRCRCRWCQFYYWIFICIHARTPQRISAIEICGCTYICGLSWWRCGLWIFSLQSTMWTHNVRDSCRRSLGRREQHGEHYRKRCVRLQVHHLGCLSISLSLGLIQCVREDTCNDWLLKVDASSADRGFA